MLLGPLCVCVGGVSVCSVCSVSWKERNPTEKKLFEVGSHAPSMPETLAVVTSHRLQYVVVIETLIIVLVD